MGEVAGWIAPIATAIAAMMTASNLGTRVTGWGFVIFTVGSVAWITEAVTTGQTNLLLANAFLTLVNIVGIWRWLGRQATYDKGAQAAETDSERTQGPDLFQLGALPGKPVTGMSDTVLGHIVDAMAERGTGRICYLVVREGSEAALNERLHALPWARVTLDQDQIRLVGLESIEDVPEIDPAHWPARISPEMT